jgi:single-strand DNA-binding protein
MNIFTCTARLGRDAEVRVTKGGTAVCSFTGAVDSGYGDKKTTTWVQFALFGKRAEGNLPEYLVKGAQVAISGEISTDEYQDKEGNNRFSLRCIVGSLDLIGGKQESKPAQQPAPQQIEEDFEDDIPF